MINGCEKQISKKQMSKKYNNDDEVKLMIQILFAMIISLFCFPTYAVDWNFDLYSQTTFLHKFNNPISQTRLLTKTKFVGHEFYVGLFVDQDKKTKSTEAYTDAQVSPLLGFQSLVFGNEWLYNRYFVEGRSVNRTTSFPDDRVKSTYEFRSGLIGYGKKDLKQEFFIENYYALFFTHLYGSRVILQSWARQGRYLFLNLDIFNEFFLDTFDQTRNSEASFDLRPGIRYQYRYKAFSLQLIHQYLYHMSNLNISGRNEHRSSLVLGLYY